LGTQSNPLLNFGTGEQKMENLNAEQIKKALERCANEWHCGLCGFTEKECALIKNSALALITSQEQRIKELAEENERLHASCTELTQCCTKLETLYKIECKRVDTVKADTVRKMQERLMEKLYSVPTVYNAHFGRMIDQIAKEMLEGDNGIQDK
jgi:DNA repair ATPase RecN